MTTADVRPVDPSATPDGDPADGLERWRHRYAAAEQAGRVRDADFSTLSGEQVEPVYGPADGDRVANFDRIGWPGESPFTRGRTPPGTAASRGPFASSPASATPRTPTGATG